MESIIIRGMSLNEDDLKNISSSLKSLVQNNFSEQYVSIREEIAELERRIDVLRRRLKIYRKPFADSKVKSISTKIERLDYFIQSGMCYTRTSEVLGVRKSTLRGDIEDAIRLNEAFKHHFSKAPLVNDDATE